MSIEKQTILRLALTFGITANLLIPSTAFALPEEMLGTHNGGVIAQAIIQAQNENHGDITSVRDRFSMSNIPILDDLWAARRDVVQGACTSTQNNCRVLSVFQGNNSSHPLVMLPGFTGYRKLYLEEIYDLIQAGYGPIYISDYTGTGDSFKQELKPGEPEPTIAQYLEKYKSKGVDTAYLNQITADVGADNAAKIKIAVDQLSIGVGYVRRFDDYIQDVDFIMNTAVAENPSAPILLQSLSMSGLTALRAFAVQDKQPTWISHVDRVLLESPMTRVKATDHFLPGTGLFSDLIVKFGEALFGAPTVVTPGGSVAQFVDKATGTYNPENVVSRSPNRVTLTDGMRTWSGKETAGGTYGWADQDFQSQYSEDPLDNLPLGSDPLNNKTKAIADVLSKYRISLIVVASVGDQLVNEPATERFMHDLAKAGLKSDLCTFQTAQHQIDIESDKYRDPFMALFYDQLNRTLKPVYGDDATHEALQCKKIEN